MLIEEAEKLYNKLAKELVDKSITDYARNIPTLLLSQYDEVQNKQRLSPQRLLETCQHSSTRIQEGTFIQPLRIHENGEDKDN